MTTSMASAAGDTGDALPYTSPSIVTILVLASYLLFLSIFYHAFQTLFSAGIIGPLVLGAIYARPLANILPYDVQSAILAIGYLGLILLIVQGGKEARMDILSSPKNLVIALLVGSTGVILPIGISMALLPLGFGYGYLESFAVGAALAATSLGTTFAVLNSFNGNATTAGKDIQNKTPHNSVGKTRIGTILVGAALLDDIVGLVITSIISTLGSTAESQQGGIASIKPWTIARPIVSSFLLIVVSWLLSQLALLPLARRIVVPRLARRVQASQSRSLRNETSAGFRFPSIDTLSKRLMANKGLQQLIALTVLISVVLAYCVISEEIGSSLLIGAFCYGAVVKSLYACWEDQPSTLHTCPRDQSSEAWSPQYLLSDRTALGVVQDTLLMPFFVSSIGSAIPVKSMFQGTTVWRGVIFAGLMAFAKVGAGVWIFVADLVEQRWSDRKASKPLQKERSGEPTEPPEDMQEASETSLQMQPRQESSSAAATRSTQVTASRAMETDAPGLPSHAALGTVKRPLIWPVSLFLGTALMSRGEIGFLVINIAKQGGLVDQQAFNVAIWAIVLNTLAGPVAVGILMRSRHGKNIAGRGSDSDLGRWT